MPTCYTCKRWQGNKYSTCADCNWVCGELELRLFDEKDIRGYSFHLPFDPHCVGDFDVGSNFNKLWMELMKDLPEGVTVDKVDGLEYLQTKASYYCKQFTNYPV